MSLVISKVFTYDTDAGNYIQAVEGPAGDNQALEPAVRQAINNFVIGCKQDGIWSAIKASCILAGARTLSGALVPLAGTAPTNNGPFVAGDYNRKTGLVGGSGKYLDSGLRDDTLPQNSCHQSVFVSEVGNANFNSPWLGVEENYLIQATLLYTFSTGVYSINRRSAGGTGNVTHPASNFFAGHSRSSNALTTILVNSTSVTNSLFSVPPTPYNHFIFAKNRQGVAQASCTSRLAFYSIGESLDLARLNSRVTDLITAFGAAIP